MQRRPTREIGKHLFARPNRRNEPLVVRLDCRSRQVAPCGGEHIRADGPAQAADVVFIANIQSALGAENPQIQIIQMPSGHPAGVDHADRPVRQPQVHVETVIGIKGVFADLAAGGLIKRG